MVAKNQTSKGINKHERDYFEHLVIFFLNPILALIIAIKHFKLSSSRNITWFFVTFYGLTMIIGVGGNDSARYRDRFIERTRLDVNIFSFIESLFDGTTNSIDIMQPTISYIVSCFTSNPHILFGVFGLIFGYFYSRNIWYLLHIVQHRLNKQGVFLVAIFAVIIGFWSITGFRMWTAAHIFFYGTIMYLVEKKKRGFIFVFLSILFHFSFLFPAVILCVYLLIGNKLKYYFVFFVLTIFVSELDLNQAQKNMLNFAPQVFHIKIESYTNSDYSENLKIEKETNRNWRYKFYPLAIKWSAVAFLISIFWLTKKKEKKLSKYLIDILSFTLLFGASTNIVSLLPSGGRFSSVFYLFVFFLTTIIIQGNYKNKIMQNSFYITAPFLAFYAIGEINVCLPNFGFSILTNPIVLFFYNSEVQLIDLI